MWMSLAVLAMAGLSNARYIMYLTGQHNLVPHKSLVADVTHVALAFMRSDIFNEPPPSEWPLFTHVQDVRDKFAANTAVMIAIGGWGDTKGFSQAAATEESRKAFAENVKIMLADTGADGVDVDWEYPGGNGEDYKKIHNSEKTWEIDAYPKLLNEIRTAIGPDKIMSAAVPGLPRDMFAFTKTTIPEISKSLDFFNIMTYDLMNRRDNITRHHTGISNSLAAIDAYLSNGVAPEKANLGFAFYVKWFKTDPHGGCIYNPIGCKTAVMEDPETGDDLGMSGAFSWHDEIPKELTRSFEKAVPNAQWDDNGNYWWDAHEKIFWSWDTPASMARKFPEIVQARGLGGVFAWGLGEDAYAWVHLRTLTTAVRKYIKSKSKSSARPEKEEL